MRLIIILLAVMILSQQQVAIADHISLDELKRLALVEGDSGAPLQIGAAYAVGHGVGKDTGLAYVWWSLAAARGETKVAKALVPLVKSMSKDELRAAHELDSRCKANGYGDC